MSKTRQPLMLPQQTQTDNRQFLKALFDIINHSILDVIEKQEHQM